MAAVRLRRVRLDGIGPPGARFDPLTIDLTTAGAASPVALLFLENGGGKSVLLRLVFSVVLPGRRNVVGGAKLTDYVLARDVGHVICEWEVDDGRLIPSLLVTGKVFEWQGGNRSANADNLRESWYSFHPSPAVVDFDTLSTRHGGRRISRVGFLAGLTEAQRSAPELNLVVEHSPGAWREHLLKNTPLDPELFRYQRAMNVDESDADELFAKVTTGETFVRFLLRAAADPDELRGFGALFDAYATQAANRSALELQRLFAEAALGALGTLAGAEERRRSAADRQAEAVRRADLFARSLLAAVAVADHQVEAHTAAAATAKERAELAGSESNRFENFTRELRRQAAMFDLADAEALAADAGRAVEAAALELAGWQAVPAIGEARRATIRRRELAEAVAQAAKEEAPYRRARDRAAAALRAAVERDKAGLEHQAEEATGAADELDQRAETARRAASEAEAHAARADAKSEQLGEVVAAADGERTRLVAAGVLSPAEPAAAARDRHDRVAAVADERLAAIAGRRAAILGQQRSLAERDRSLADRLVSDDTELRSAEAELERFQRAVREFLSAERVVALVGDSAELWPAAERVGQILEEAVAAAETRQRDLAVEMKDDEEALDSLGLEGRLPASSDVVAALAALRVARVPATTGWSYLAQLDQPARERALAGNPSLAGGIIVTNPSELDRARDVLADAGLDMRSIVAVGPAADLDAVSTATGTFAVAPNPALYDEAWTDSERQRLTARVEAARLERARLIAAADADRRLGNRLADAINRWPQEAILTLEGRAAQLRVEVESLRGARLDVAAELRQLDDELTDLEAEAGIQRSTEQRAAAAAGDTARLAEREAGAAQAREQIPQLAHLAAVRREEAARQSETEAQARRDAAARRGGAAELRRHRAGLDRVVDGVPVVDTSVDVGAELGSVDDLRAHFDVTAEALATAAVGDDLHSELAAAEAGEAAACAAVDTLPVEVRDVADGLVATPAAATPASLDEARRSAAAALGHAREEDKAAANMVALAQKEVDVTSRRDERAGRAHADLPDDWVPTDAATARHRAEEAAEIARAARSRQLAADQEQSQALSAASAARTRAQVLKAHAASLGRRDADPAELVGIAPWSGTEEGAADQAASLGEARSTAEAALAQAQTEVHRALEAVRRVAGEAHFAELGGVRQAMATEAGDSLAGRASQLFRDVGVRLASVESELAEVNKHREGVIERLSTLVEEQLKLVALARRFSRIPTGLGEWSDQQFCRIDFHSPDHVQLSARVGGVVDDCAVRSRRDPLEVVLDATVAAVLRRSAGGDTTFEVRLLKPNKAMFVDTVDVSRMGEEYSGGQRLTTAILLYCTLAAVRTHARGGAGGAGVLFLDNPIGKASADYLLDLQTAVAHKFGVQLVYTTGLFDPEVHDAFDCIVRLRNDADLRRHLNYIVLDESTAAAVIEGREPGDRHGYVSGVRLSLLEPKP